MLAFGGGHIAGALNLGARPSLSGWAGWLLDPEDFPLLVMSSDEELEEVVSLFWRVGFTCFGGYLAGGIKAWDDAGLPLGEILQMTVYELNIARENLQIIDVRSPGEWKEGHMSDAHHLFLPLLRKNIHQLSRTQPVVTYCESGYRASIAASTLRQEGFTEVRNIPGSWKA